MLVTVRVPLREPAAMGEKVTAIWHIAPGATLAQLLVCVKSPVTAMFEMFSAALPTLVAAIIHAALDMPVPTLP